MRERGQERAGRPNISATGGRAPQVLDAIGCLDDVGVSVNDVKGQASGNWQRGSGKGRDP